MPRAKKKVKVDADTARAIVSVIGSLEPSKVQYEAEALNPKNFEKLTANDLRRLQFEYHVAAAGTMQNSVIQTLVIMSAVLLSLAAINLEDDSLFNFLIRSIGILVVLGMFWHFAIKPQRVRANAHQAHARRLYERLVVENGFNPDEYALNK